MTESKQFSLIDEAGKYVNKTNLLIIAFAIFLISSGLAVGTLKRRVEEVDNFPYDKVKTKTGMSYVVLGETRFYGTHFRAYSYDPTDESLEPEALGEWVDGFVDPLNGVHIIRTS